MQGRKPGAKGQKTAKKERNFLLIVERPKIIKMKKVKQNKKLQINKETIAKLNSQQMNNLVGGLFTFVEATCPAISTCVLQACRCDDTFLNTCKC